jgi:single-stranded-DNA-specific exonuclease
VVFKLIQALYMELHLSDMELRAERLLDLVALGTIADSVPLTGENRIFVACGLNYINGDSVREGIEALKRIAGIKNEIRSELLSYTLIPRVNAAGRLDDANQAVELFLAKDRSVADKVASVLEDRNRRRQKIESEVFKDAVSMIDPDRAESAIVLSSPDWHPGVVGIVASRLVNMFYRPVFLFSVKDSVAKGSARSIPPIHIQRAVSECSDLLLAFGGHCQAAGVKLLAEKLPEFRNRIISLMDKCIDTGNLMPTLEIDAAVKLSDINFNLMKELSMLEPYGDSNREPVFGSRGISIENRKTVGNNHVKMRLKQDSARVDSKGLSMSDKF